MHHLCTHMTLFSVMIKVKHLVETQNFVIIVLITHFFIDLAVKVILIFDFMSIQKVRKILNDPILGTGKIMHAFFIHIKNYYQ